MNMKMWAIPVVVVVVAGLVGCAPTASGVEETRTPIVSVSGTIGDMGEPTLEPIVSVSGVIGVDGGAVEPVGFAVNPELVASGVVGSVQVGTPELPETPVVLSSVVGGQPEGQVVTGYECFQDNISYGVVADPAGCSVLFPEIPAETEVEQGVGSATSVVVVPPVETETPPIYECVVDGVALQAVLDPMDCGDIFASVVAPVEDTAGVGVAVAIRVVPNGNP